MLKEFTKEELASKLIQSNIEVIKNNIEYIDTLYRDDNKHVIAVLSVGYSDFSPLEWSGNWTVEKDGSLEDLSELFGDHVYDIKDKSENIEDFFENLAKYADKKGYFIEPVARYEHSAVKYYNGIGSGFDGCTSGYAYAKKSDIKKDFNVKIISQKLHEKMIHQLDITLDNYTQFCNGEVYNITIYDTFDKSVVDSLGEVYNADIKYCLEDLLNDNDIK